MVDLSDVEAVRPYPIRMCRSPALRINPPNLDIQKHNWRPFTVIEDATRSKYTDAGAWAFIADCLQAGAETECKPPTSEHRDYAYVMKCADAPGARRIYTKIAIIPPHVRVLGISFHFEQPR